MAFWAFIFSVRLPPQVIWKVVVIVVIAYELFMYIALFDLNDIAFELSALAYSAPLYIVAAWYAFASPHIWEKDETTPNV